MAEDQSTLNRPWFLNTILSIHFLVHLKMVQNAKNYPASATCYIMPFLV